MRHGTHWGYSSGCRCIDCRAMKQEYSNQLRSLTIGYGPVVSVKAASIRALMADRGIDDADLADTLGVAPGTISQRLKSCRMGLYTLDKMAVALGSHYMLLTDDDCVSKEAS